MKKLLEAVLRGCTRKIIKKYHPRIIGITGSVGKTSAREAIYTVLSSKWSVRRPIKNYNNELGVPLTFIGAESGGKAFFKWLGVVCKALKLILSTDKNFPQVFVIEMGVYQRGDIKYLTDFVPCDVGVVTAIAESHLERMGSFENIIAEKMDLARVLPKTSSAVLNIDDENIREHRDVGKAKVVTFGFSDDATVRASDVILSGQAFDEKTDVSQIKGVSFKVAHQGSSMPFMLPKVLGKQHIYAALAATAVGILFEMNLIEISEALRKYHAPNGRMNLIAGVKHTLIIDDTYNASSPVSVKLALEVARDISLEEGKEKFVVLGDMLELGAVSAEAHADVGRAVAKMKFGYFVAVGERMDDAARAAREAGMPEERIYSFVSAEGAGTFVQARIEQGDLLLVKGSQGMRMEKVVKELMAEPLRAGELLVRQDAEWLKT